MCITNPSRWPLFMWNMKNMVGKRQKPYNRKTQSLFVAAVPCHTYVWCASLLLYIRLSHILCVTDSEWPSRHEHCRTVPLPCVLRMFCFYIFIETDEMGHTTCHSNLPLIKFFSMLCVLSVFVTLLLHCEFLSDCLSVRVSLTQTVTKLYNWLRHEKRLSTHTGRHLLFVRRNCFYRNQPYSI